MIALSRRTCAPLTDVRRATDVENCGQGGDAMRAKFVRILISGAGLATMLMAAGAKWKV
jgi:hypothetical protein